jgi:hypothetical protein
MTARFFFTRNAPSSFQRTCTTLLVLLLCLCKSFQWTLSFAFLKPFVLESGCKGTAFFRISKSFCRKIPFLSHFFRFLYKGLRRKGLRPYYIIHKLLSRTSSQTGNPCCLCGFDWTNILFERCIYLFWCLIFYFSIKGKSFFAIRVLLL